MDGLIDPRTRKAEEHTLRKGEGNGGDDEQTTKLCPWNRRFLIRKCYVSN